MLEVVAGTTMLIWRIPRFLLGICLVAAPSRFCVTVAAGLTLAPSNRDLGDLRRSPRVVRSRVSLWRLLSGPVDGEGRSRVVLEAGRTFLPNWC